MCVIYRLTIHQYVVSPQAIFQKFAMSSRAGFRIICYHHLQKRRQKGKKDFILQNCGSKPDLFFTDFHLTQGYPN